MAVTRVLLIEGAESWWLASSEQVERAPADSDQLLPICDHDTAFSELANKLVGSLAASLSGAKRRVQLGVLLRSSSVLFSCFDLAEIGGTKNSSSIPYRLETDLPFSAEEVFADWCICPSGQVSAFAVERAKLLSIREAVLDQAKENGLHLEVGLVAPSSLVTAQCLVEQGKVSADCVLLLERNGYIEYLELESQAPKQWRLMHLNASSAEWNLLLGGSHADRPIYMVCQSEGQGWKQNLGVEAVELESSTHTETQFGLELLARPRRAWSDFARDPAFEGGEKVSRQWAQLLSMASVCCLLVALGFFYRSSLLDQKTSDLQMQQASLFKTTFPGQRKPAAILKRFRSEYAKAIGSRATGSGDLSTPQQAVPILGELVDALPSDLEFAVSEFRVEDGAIYLDLQVEKHEDAGQIVEALRTDEIEFSPPSTEAADSKITALIRGKKRGRKRVGNQP